jgi:hypothetical protein
MVGLLAGVLRLSPRNYKQGDFMKRNLFPGSIGLICGAVLAVVAMLTMGAGQDSQVSVAVAGNFVYVTDSQTKACFVYQVGDNGWTLTGTADLNTAGSPTIVFAR